MCVFLLFFPVRAAFAQNGDPGERLRAEVTAVETAFADTMARRDFEAFAGFVADDAIFMSGGNPLRGKAAVLARWKGFFEGEHAPFSWKPDYVEVLASGDLAQSNGPVFAPDGKLVARFYSTWRKRPDGRWEIVFDNGYSVAPSAENR
jgi:ketosteroid isomerase-like protein